MRLDVSALPPKSPGSKLFCRQRIAADEADLIALWVASWQEVMPQIDFVARRSWFEDHLHGLEKAGFVTICAVGEPDILLGFMALNPLTHMLDQLAVRPAAWGTGVAVRLLAEARLLSPELLILDVNCDNHRAVRFYEREGFQRVGEGVNALSGLKTWRLHWQRDEAPPNRS